jgi:hypothetical protein
MEEEIIKQIRATYPEDVWLPVPKEDQAKDAVAAQLIRDMAPAMASIAVQVFSQTLQDIRKEIVTLPNGYVGTSRPSKLPEEEKHEAKEEMRDQALQVIDKHLNEKGEKPSET